MPRLPGKTSYTLTAASLAFMLAAACSTSPSPAPAAPPPAGPKPTVVLVHGAWAETSSWDGEVQELQKQGYVARAIPNPLDGLLPDAESVKDFLATIHGPIVLVGHSYGGAVITNAAAGNPNVKALVYIDAVAPAIGETNIALIGEKSALAGKSDDELYDKVSYPGAPEGASKLYLKRDAFLKDFGSDLPADVADRLWAGQSAVSTVAFSTPTAAAAWTTIPSWFFISSGDQIITAGSKEQMAARAQSHITHFDGGSHLTLISHPDAVTKTIDEAASSLS